MDYDIKSLPDYAALQQFARALWRNGSVRGASVLVGAGLSKNAKRPSEESLAPPLWYELLDRMVERLYPHDPKLAPTNALRIAEEYRTYFGQAGLDEFIRSNFPDKSWTPGQLHADLLELPWTDVLTTNWDTLLERAAENSAEYAYEVVRTEADLTFAKSPRIVKLHGTLGDAGPLIFAEEDYRTYPTKYAAFVNFARQVFIENELCLVGFSGDDPNFQQWAGWVRDHLGGSARRIYLIGNLRLERATRRYLEAHNIAPIDFAPLVKEWPRDQQHAEATRIFLDELRKAKPAPQHEWKLTPAEQFPLFRAGADAYQRVPKDHPFAAELLEKTIPLFKADRESYPGWFVCPHRHRQSLLNAGDAHWLLRKPVLDLLKPEIRGQALFEIVWRRTIRLSPIDEALAAALAELVEAKPEEVAADVRLELALALLRDARLSCDADGMKRWADVIEAEPGASPALRLDVAYQWALRARDRMELSTLQTRLASITSEEPIWKLRRAALHTEIGEYATATRLIKEATADLERRFRLDRNSLSIKSQLAWAAWISRATDMLYTRWSDLPRLRDFRELDIDPADEIERFENSAAEIEKKRREDEIAVRPAFEAGHYRDNSATIRLGPGNPGIVLLFEFDLLIEQVGLPIRINHVNICANAATAVVQEARQPTVEWHVWLFRALHSHMDRLFEHFLSRVAVARLSPAVNSAITGAVEATVSYWSERLQEARTADRSGDFHRATDTLRFSLIILSRLTVWMSPKQTANTVRRACEMAKEPLLSHFWLIEAIGELAKYAAGAVPLAEQGSLAFPILEFPLPSEKGANMSSWPRLVTEIWDAQPVRDASDKRWDHRIAQLLAAAQKGQPDREHAILRLAYLSLRNTLKPEEATAFGIALWSDVDAHENALPQNTSLSISGVLELPAPDEVDVQARLRARLFDVDLPGMMKLQKPMSTIEIGQRLNHLDTIAHAVQLGLALPAGVALRMFDEIVVWELQTVDRQDPFARSFVKGFNDNIRRSAGYLLATAVVPALDAEQRTEQRARDFLTFIARTRSWTSLGAIPLFWSSTEGVRSDLMSVVRRGLISSESQHVSAAALAIGIWAKLSRSGAIAEPPRSLVEQLITTIEACGEIGLPALLGAARELLRNDFLHDEDLKRLVETLAVIRSEFRYENVELDTMRAVSVSLVRAASVKLAAALIGRVADDGTLQGWIDDAKSDPLPEVRFALTKT
ncbi:SIR2 family NAD-dependent protein deacylase [Bradyrhizobium diazoefficiens]